VSNVNTPGSGWSGESGRARPRSASITEVRLRANKLISGLEGPPFALDCKTIRDAAEITRIVHARTLRAHGRVFWEESGYVIEIKGTLGPARRAFTLGHEIAHTFFMQPSDGVVSQRVDMVTEAFAVDDQEEYLCDAAAAEMLMPAAALLNRRQLCTPNDLAAPENAFLNRVLTYKPSARSVVALARDFGTSLAATSRRFAEMDAWSCHIGFWKPNDTGHVEFQSGYLSGSTKVGIPAGFVASRLSIVAAVAAGRKRAEGWSNIGLSDRIGEPYGKAYVEAVPIGDDRVLTVTVLEPAPESLVSAFDGARKKTPQTSLRFRKRLQY
jgi:Zn-dependent peptidase ImmA (M78 family)